MLDNFNENLVQESEIFIIGHKIFIRLKDITKNNFMSSYGSCR